MLADPPLQRAVGSARLGVRRTPAGTSIHTLRQSGCLKLRFPRTHCDGLDAVLINISGGVADGDSLNVAVQVGEDCALTLCTPSAERIYPALPGKPAARIGMHARIEAGARLDYLPQETLLFEGCALDRSFDIDVDARGTFLGVEARLFGRALSGETITMLTVHDRMTMRRAGHLVLQETLRLQGDVRAILSAKAGAAGHLAAATVVYAAADAERFLDPVRDAVEGAQAGASAWNGLLVARLLAADGQALRRTLLPVLKILLGKPLPRLWAS